MPARPYPSLVDRIIANTALAHPEDDQHHHNGTPCWLWLGACNSRGYGRLTIRNRRGQPRAQLVHRLVLLHFCGEPVKPKKKIGMHACNHVYCVSPNHLSLGTCRENMKQMHAEGRDRWSRERAQREALSPSTHIDNPFD